MGHYRYHELRPLTGYFPCHWLVPVDFPNTCTMKIVRIFYRINRYGGDFYTLTRSFPNEHWYNKSTYDLVERLLSPFSFYKYLSGLVCDLWPWLPDNPTILSLKVTCLQLSMLDKNDYYEIEDLQIGWSTHWQIHFKPLDSFVHVCVCWVEGWMQNGSICSFFE